MLVQPILNAVRYKGVVMGAATILLVDRGSYVRCVATPEKKD